MKCVGCGYCCMKSPCIIAAERFRWELIRDKRCPALVWRKGRYFCKEAEEDETVAGELAVGEGCCSSMNTWRGDVRERQTLYPLASVRGVILLADITG